MDREKIGHICNDVSKIFAQERLTFSEVVEVFHSLMIFALDTDKNFPAGRDTAHASVENTENGNAIKISTTFDLKRNGVRN